jgi:Flp pilus assembly pilin Flp
MRRWVSRFGALRFGLLACVVAVAFVATAASAAPTPTHKQAVFRTDLIRFFTGMKPVVAKLDRSGVVRGDAHNVATIDRGIASIEKASPADLATLQHALSAYPAWRSLPMRLNTLAARLPSGTTHHFGTKITPDDCATAENAGFTQTDIEIATDAAFAADVILEAVPQDTLDEPVRIAAVIIWAVPQTVLRGFSHLYNIAQACQGNDLQATVNGLSSSLTTIVTNISALTTDVDNSFTTIINNLATLKTDVDNSFTTVVNNIATLKTDVDNSFTTVSTKITNVQTSVDTANTKIDTLTTNVAANNTLNIRLHIEEDLASPGRHPIALFETPAAQGGYLEMARSIVADIIQKMTATGQGSGNAQAFLTSADSEITAGKFKAAYSDLGKAYQAAAS